MATAQLEVTPGMYVVHLCAVGHVENVVWLKVAIHTYCVFGEVGVTRKAHIRPC